MRTWYAIALMSVLLLLGYYHTDVTAITDPSGDHIGAADIVSATAEHYMRGDGVTLLKISVTSTPHLPGLILFESNVDNTGDVAMLTEFFQPPVAPCPCKTAYGIDVGIMVFTRSQGDNSQTAFCRGCLDQQQQACSKGRKAGEWYAYASALGMENGLGVIRGFLDPIPAGPESGGTYACYTLPWGTLLMYAYAALDGDTRQFNLEQAFNPANNKWTISIWHDQSFADQDDFADGTTFLNISDWIPNGTGVMADMQPAGPYTYCEGNFDNDFDQDGLDASRFKQNFGRSPISFKCPGCAPHY